MPPIERARHVAAGILHLSGGHRHVVPAVVRPQGRQHRQAERRHAAARGARRRCQVRPVGRRSTTKAMPSTTIAMPATLRMVSAVCTRPPTTTVRQLTVAKNTIAAIATTCVRPNCQCIVRPSDVVGRLGPGRAHRHDGREKRRKADAEDRDRSGSGDDEAHPSEEKRRQLAVGLAKVDVLAAGVRQHRAELRIAQRAGEREQAGGDPGRQHEQRRAGILRHDRRLDEDAGADHRADDQRRRIRERQAANELGRLGHKSGAGCRVPGATCRVLGARCYVLPANV